MEYGIPVYGTMAHSYIMSFPDELSAFRAFAKDFPGNAFLLIDTYDTVQGARHAITVARELAEQGRRLRGVRIDSGDLADLSTQVRALLEAAGLSDVQILLSGELDEDKIERLLANGASADAFGVGTEMGTSGDAPSLGGVYKLVEDNQGPKVKLSTGKATLPGQKQVWRIAAAEGPRDVLALVEEPPPPGGEPLLVKVMEEGRTTTGVRLADSRARALSRLHALPAPWRHLHAAPAPPVTLSDELQRLQQEMYARLSS